MKKILFISVFVISSCVNNKYQSTSTSEKLSTKSDLAKLVIIEPEFIYKNFTDEYAYKFFKSDEKDSEFRTVLLKETKRLKIDAEVYDKKSLSEDDVFYYNDLIPLKNEILTNLIKLDVDTKEDKKKNTYLKTPIVDAKYSELVEQFDTKYFATTGIISVKDKARVNWPFIIIPPLMLHTFQPYKESLYYFIVVNVENGEIEYQELRYNHEKMTKTNMSIYVYDSIKALKKYKN